MRIGKKRRALARSVGRYMGVVIALAVFIVPTLVTAWWFLSSVRTVDPRKLQPVAAFHIRGVDNVVEPLRPFREPIISVTFDDGWESVYTQAFPVMQQDGICSTQYIITKTLTDPAYMSLPQLRTMAAACHEIGSHTMSHPDLTTLGQAALVYELAASQQTLEHDFGTKVQDFTSPYGAYNAYTLGMIRKYYRSQKNAEGTDDPSDNPLGTINTANTFNPLNFHSFSIRNDTSVADIQHLIDETRAYNGWLVLTYHQVDTSREEYSVTPAMFKKQLEAVSSSPLRSATVGRFMDAWFKKGSA